MVKYRRSWMVLCLAWALGLGPAFAQNDGLDKPPADDPAWDLCADTAAQVGAELGLPAHLLEAIALTETGWAGPNRRLASWPWTVHDGTRGYHFASREEAIKFVRNLRTDGRRSIDVGCMQINLRHHPRAFTSVDEGFDPAANIRYAASFLVQLKDQFGDWQDAIERYHSYNPDFYREYATKVIAFWQRENAKAVTLAKAGSNAKRVAQAPTAKPALVASAAPVPAHASARSKGEARSHSKVILAAVAPGAEAEASGETGASSANPASALLGAPDEADFSLRRVFGSPR